MSFNNNHISLENYQEYLLLYVDDELTAEEKAMVDAFLLLHPDLQIELELLMATRLPAEPLAFTGRQQLLAHHMKREETDELLLSFIDNELSASENAAVQSRLSKDAGYTRQHALLLRARLDASDIIAYPNKQELYRHTAKIASIKTWLQMAAAVVLVLFASLLYLNRQGNTDLPVAKQTPPQNSQQALPQPASEPVIARQPKAEAIQNNAKPQPSQAAVAQHRSTKQAHEALKKEIALGETSNPELPRPLVLQPLTAAVAPNEIALKLPEESRITLPVVTSGPVTSFNDQEAAFTASAGETKNKGSLKGFLRKATRLIERNTGIGTTTEDNELLIGALAVKLK